MRKHSLHDTVVLWQAKMKREHLLQAKVRNELRRRLNSRGHFQLATLELARLLYAACLCVNYHIDTMTIWSAGSGAYKGNDLGPPCTDQI